MARIFLPFILCILLVSCAPSPPPDEIIGAPVDEVTETGGTLDEWRHIIIEDTGADSLASKRFADCDAAIQQQVNSCPKEGGWMVDNSWDISIFGSDEHYTYQRIAAEGTCPQEDSPRTTVDTKLFDGVTDEYQVICSINCYTWDCPVEEPKLNARDLACPTLPGFSPGNVYAANPAAEPREFVEPRLLGGWGAEGSLFCHYFRQAGVDFDGNPYNEGAMISANFQVDGSFADRPDWAIDNFCSGSVQNRDPHVDIFSSSHVASVTYITRTDYGDDVTAQAKAAAEQLLQEIEKGYAIRCR